MATEVCATGRKRRKYRFESREAAERAQAEASSRAWHLEQGHCIAPAYSESAVTDDGWRYQLTSYAPERADEGSVIITVQGPDDRRPYIFWAGSPLDSLPFPYWGLPLRVAMDRLVTRIRRLEAREGGAA